MNHLLVPCLLAAAAAGTNALGIDLGPDTHVSLGTTCTVGVVVIGGAFWIGRFMQKIEDRLSAIEKKCHGGCLLSKSPSENES